MTEVCFSFQEGNIEFILAFFCSTMYDLFLLQYYNIQPSVVLLQDSEDMWNWIRINKYTVIAPAI